MIGKIRFVSLTLIGILGVVLATAPISVALYPPIDEYDSFADISSPENRGYPDGEIDLYDLMFLALKYGTEGNPQRNVTFVDTMDVNVTNWPDRWTWYPAGDYNQKMVVFSSEALFNPPSPVYRGGVRLNENSDFAFLFQPVSETFNVTNAYLLTTLHNIHNVVETTRFSVTINGQTQEFSTTMSVHEQCLAYASLQINSTLTDTIRQGINTMKLSSEGWHSGTSQWVPNYSYEIVLLVEYEC